MAVYVTKKCPNCGFAYQVLQGGDQRKYGCPLKTCTRCGCNYWDTDIKEPALYGYNNFHEVKEDAKIGCLMVILVPTSIMGIVGGILVLTSGELWGIILLLIGVLIIYLIVNFFIVKNKENNSLEKERAEYDASMERLQNMQYLSALAQHDSKAEKLLLEKRGGAIEHYASRP